MAEQDHFSMLAAEFETLQNQFENASDGTTRKLLLAELRGKLEEIDKLVRRHLDELAGT